MIDTLFIVQQKIITDLFFLSIHNNMLKIYYPLFYMKAGACNFDKERKN